MDKHSQLQRRFDEIAKAYNKSSSSAKDIKEFYARILDFTEFLQGDAEFKKLLTKNLADKRLRETEDKLTLLGEEIVHDSRAAFEKIKNLLEEKNLNFPTSEEIHKDRKTGIYSITPDESLGIDIEMLENKLKKERDKEIEDIPKIINMVRNILFNLKFHKRVEVSNLESIFKELIKKEDAYRILLDQRARRLDFLCIPEYLELLSVEEAINNNGDAEKGFAFKMTDSYKYARPASDEWTSPRDPQGIQKEKDKYFHSAERTKNLILDLLEGRKHYFKNLLIGVNEYWEMQIVRDFLKWIVPLGVTFIVGGLVWEGLVAWVLALFDR